MSFGATPVDGSTTPIPMSSVVPDGTSTPLAVEGGPSISTGGNNLAPVSMYAKDGNMVTQGAIADAAVVGDNSGTISAKLRGLTKIFNDVWDSVNHRLHVTVDNATALGQTTMANSSPVTLASNQTGIGTVALPNINDQWITAAVRAGQAYSVSSGVLASATNPSLTLCSMSLFNPAASGKSILIVSIISYAKADITPGTLLLRATTVDPSGTAGFTNVITPVNLRLGGGVGVASASSTANNATASITPTGSIIAAYAQRVDTPGDLLPAGIPILLPAGSANGIEVTQFVAVAADTYSCLVKYVEF